MKKNFLLTSMCLVSLLGLGACSGPNINNKRLKENEELVVYASDFTYGNQYYLYLAAKYSTTDTVRISNGFSEYSEKYENSYLEYSIKSNYASLKIKAKTTKKLKVNYTISCSNLLYYIVSMTEM